jgi:uracil-DNA glycosylase family 4
LWHGKLNPELMIIGQDWGDTKCFAKQRGMENPNSPTNKALTDLIHLIGLNLDAIFLTNAILCLKSGGLQAPVKLEWFTNCGIHFLKATIEVVNPKILVTMGEHAYRSVEMLFNLPRVPFRRAVDNRQGFSLPPVAGKIYLQDSVHSIRSNDVQISTIRSFRTR